MAECFLKMMNGNRSIVWLRLMALLLSGVFLASADLRAAEVIVTPTLAVKEEYNSNIFLIDKDRVKTVAAESEAETQPVTEPKLDDFITTIFPGVELGVNTERFNSLISLSLGIVNYADLSDLNDTNEFYKGNFGYLFSDYTRVQVGAGYTKDSNPDRELDQTGLLLGTFIRRRQDYNFSVEHDLTEVNTARLSYAFQKDDFSNSSLTDELERVATFRDRLDSDMQRAGLGYFHDVGKWVPNLFGYSSFDFTYYKTDLTRQYNYAASIGAKYELSDLFNITGDVGVRYSQEKFDDIQLRLLSEQPFFEELDIERSQDSWGPVGHLAINYLGEVTNAGLKFAYDVQPASGRGTLAKRTEFRFDISRWFAPKLNARAFATYFLNKVDPVSPLPVLADEEARQLHNDIPELKSRLDEVDDLPLIDEKVFIASLVMTYEINRYVSIEGSYSYTMFKRENLDSDARRNLVFLKIDFRYPFLD